MEYYILYPGTVLHPAKASYVVFPWQKMVSPRFNPKRDYALAFMTVPGNHTLGRTLDSGQVQTDGVGTGRQVNICWPLADFFVYDLRRL